MKWGQVVEAVQDTILGNAALVSIYGTAIRYNGTADFTVPVLEVQVIGDSERETDTPIIVQLDQWCASMADLIASELILRRLFHREVPEDIGGLVMWAQYEDGSSLASPDRDGYFARAIRFRFTPLRDRYDPVVPIS